MKSFFTWLANLGILAAFILGANALAAPPPADASSAPRITFTQVQPTLASCQGCHAGYNYPAIADFSKFPFVAPEKWARGEDSVYWIRRIASRMNLAEQGKFATMPPAWAYENSAEDIELFTQWIRGGAMDADGNRVLSDEQVSKLLTGR